jgi:hypothetical protein
MATTHDIRSSDRGANLTDQYPDPSEEKAFEESRNAPISKPGGFQNDPADPTNPNEAIERSRRKLRP